MALGSTVESARDETGRTAAQVAPSRPFGLRLVIGRARKVEDQREPFLIRSLGQAIVERDDLERRGPTLCGDERRCELEES